MGGRGRLLLGTVVCLASLASASSAFAANTVNIVRFSKAISGNTGTAYAGTVTVDLLRNTDNAESVTQTNVVDSCTATASAGAWQCDFQTHAFANDGDLVEVNYGSGAGVPAGNPVVIGQGDPGALPPTATPEPVSFAANQIARNFGISADGAQLVNFGCGCAPFSATVDGAVQPAPVGSTLTFAAPVTNANDVRITGTFTGTLGTLVKLTDEAPVLSVAPATYTGTAPFNARTPDPQCTFYPAVNEDVCNGLQPGSFTLKQVRGGTTVSTEPFTVPAQTGREVPTQGGAKLTTVSPGDLLQLTVGSRVLASVTVAALVVHWSSPLVDLDNGNQNAVSGSCAPGELFSAGRVLCPASGSIPGTLTDNGPDLAQDDDTGGRTEVDFPDLAVSVPRYGELVHTPTVALAVPRYEDPLADALAADANPAVGQETVTQTIPTAAAVTFSYAPAGASVFRMAGNANTATGAPIPSLPAGVYVGRWQIADARGDTESFDSPFVSQGGGPTVRCTAVRGTGGVKATIASRRHSTRSSSSATLKVTCSPSAPGARVALWLLSGNNVVASGSGTARGTSVTVTLSGTLKKGTYRLIETADLNGQSTESSQTVTIKSGPKPPKHKKQKKHRR